MTTGTHRGSWIEPYPTALCRDDLCPWKYVGTTLAFTQRMAEEHVLESGHAVRVYRQLHRDIEAAPSDAPSAADAAPLGETGLDRSDAPPG